MNAEQREVDALANMMAGDSKRIDILVGDVGAIKGSVTHLQGCMGELKDGVNDLRGALTILTRHSVALERQSEDHGKVQAQMALMDGRLRSVETTLASDLPPLREARAWAVRAVLAVLGVVGLSVVGLVVIK